MTREEKGRYYYTENAICTVKGVPYRFSIEVVHGSDIHNPFNYNVDFSGVLHLGKQDLNITIVRGLEKVVFVYGHFGIRSHNPNNFVRQIIGKFEKENKSNQINKQ